MQAGIESVVGTTLFRRAGTQEGGRQAGRHGKRSWQLRFSGKARQDKAMQCFQGKARLTWGVSDVGKVDYGRVRGAVPRSSEEEAEKKRRVFSHGKYRVIQ